MAKDKPNGDELVQVPASVLKELQERLIIVEHELSKAHERQPSVEEKMILDKQYDERIRLSTLSAKERTQQIADQKYGTTGPRFRCQLDSSTPDGKPGPDVSVWFGLELCANSDLEAQARYLQIMGITSHKYRVRVEALATSDAA